ncbi:tyrosine recombinase XerC, partial [Morganella morganii]|nr:tyrosine recombinase XerC [Morganella morganii]
MTDGAADELRVAAEQFLQDLRVGSRLSPVTITNDRRQLAAVAEMMAARKLRCW